MLHQAAHRHFRVVSRCPLRRGLSAQRGGRRRPAAAVINLVDFVNGHLLTKGVGFGGLHAALTCADFGADARRDAGTGTRLWRGVRFKGESDIVFF